MYENGVTDGGRGAECPQRLLPWKFLLTYREKRGKEKGKTEQKRRKIEKWFFFSFPFFFFFFFFFWFSLYKTTKICFGFTKMGIFYREKAFHAGKNEEK